MESFQNVHYFIWCLRVQIWPKSFLTVVQDAFITNHLKRDISLGCPFNVWLSLPGTYKLILNTCVSVFHSERKAGVYLQNKCLANLPRPNKQNYWIVCRCKNWHEIVSGKQKFDAWSIIIEKLQGDLNYSNNIHNIHQQDCYTYSLCRDYLRGAFCEINVNYSYNGEKDSHNAVKKIQT